MLNLFLRRPRGGNPQCLLALVLLFAFASSPGLFAQTQLPQNPNDLLRSAVQNELKHQNDAQLYSFRQRTEKPKETTVKQMVELPDGVVGRIILINDKPLTPQQERNEDSRVNRLLDPQQWRDKVKEQKEDEQRTTRMVQALPDAFIYTYAQTPKSGSLVTLSFKPNPNFDPPSRETLVFQGMEGTVVVDTAAMRLAKVDGTMMRDVNIGWGILGHLDRGGHFYVEQAPVDGDHWDMVKMKLDFTGKALIFKTIRIKQTQTLSDFHRVEKMKMPEAIAYLKKTATSVENAANASVHQ